MGAKRRLPAGYPAVRRAGPALGATVLALLTGCRGGPPPDRTGAPPVGFPIEYRRMTRMPTCLGNLRVRIDSGGAVFSATNATECSPGEIWSTPYPDAPTRRLTESERSRLRRAVEASGLLAMPLVTDEGVTLDGVAEEIELGQGTEIRKVRVVNRSPEPFVAARDAILRAARVPR